MLSPQEMDKLRGDIISKFISIDLYVSIYITNYYLNHLSWDFIFNVLGHPQCSFGFKRDIFKHILPESSDKNEFLEKLNRLNKIRNYFAHQIPLDSEIGHQFRSTSHPDDKNKRISVVDLVTQFELLDTEVNWWLQKKLEERGVTLQPDGEENEGGLKNGTFTTQTNA